MSLSNYDPGQELASINFAGMIGGPLSAAVDAQAQAALSTVDFIKSVGFSPDIENSITGEITPGSPVYVTFKYPKLIAPYTPAVNGWVDGVAISSVSGAAGTAYVVGDVLSLGSGGATVKVDGVGTGGEITGVSVVNKGSGYSVSDEFNAGGGSGTGAIIKITSTDDTDAVPAQFEQMLLEVPMLTMMPIPYLRIDFVEIDFHAKITSMEYREVGSKFDISGGFSYSSTSSASSSGQGKVFGIGGNASASLTRSVKFNVNASYQRSVKDGHKIDKTYQLGVKVKASQDEMPGGMERILGILEDAIVAQPVLS